MVFDLVDKEGTKSGKGLGWSWFGLNDGKRDAKILRELGEIYKGNSVAAGVFDQKIKGLTVSSRDNAREMKANSANNIEFSKGLLNAAASADKMTISSKLLAGGMTALKIASNMAAGFIAGIALNFVIEQITHLVNAQKEAIEKGKEAAKTIQAINDKLKENTAYVKDNATEYAKLSQGVGNFNKNLSLSDEDYEKFLTQNEQLAAIFPELVTGIDSNGNAILNLDGSVQEITNSLNQYLAVAKQTSNQKILDNFGDDLKGNTAQVKKYRDELKKLQGEKDKLSKKALYKGVSIPLSKYENENGTNYLPEKVFKTQIEAANLANSLKSVGINAILEQAIQPDKSKAEYLYPVNFEIDESLLEYSIDNAAQTIEKKIKALEDTIRNQRLILAPSVQAYLDTSIIYGSFGEDAQNAISTVVSNLDFTGKSEQQAKSMIDDIVNIFNNNPQIAESFASLFSLDKTTMPYGEWKSQAELLINTIAEALGLTGDDRKDFIINLGFKTDELDPSINAIDEQMSKVTKEQIESLTDEEIRLLYTIDNKGDMTFDEAKVKIKELQDAAANVPIISPISNAFKPFADDMDKIQSAYQTMSSTISEYNQKGYLTIDNMQAIMALGDDYIGLLFNENGQIKLNKDGYIALANAHLDEMEAKALAAAINNVQSLTDETTATEYLTGKTKANTTATDANAEAKLKLLVAENLAKGGNISLATKQITDTFAQYKAIIDATRASLGSYTDETMGATNATKAQAEALLKAQGNAAIKSLDKRIDGLQKQLTLLDKQYEAEDALLALEKAKDAYENTKSQKTQRVYYEDRGFVWEANQSKLAEAQESIKNLEKEQARKNAKKSIQDEIDKLQDLKKKYQESMSHIGETLKEHMLEMELMAQFDGMSYEQMATYSDDYTARVIANLNAEAAAIANRNAVAASGAPSSYDVALPDRVDPISFDNKKSADEFYNKADEYYGKGVVKKYKTGGVNDTTGLAQLDGDKNHVETVFNSTDGKKLYDAIHHAPDIGELLWKNLSPHLNIKIPKIDIPMPPSQQRDQALSGSNTSNIPQCVFYDAKIVANNDSELFKRALNYAKIHNKK